MTTAEFTDASAPATAFYLVAAQEHSGLEGLFSAEASVNAGQRSADACPCRSCIGRRNCMQPGIRSTIPDNFVQAVVSTDVPAGKLWKAVEEFTWPPCASLMAVVIRLLAPVSWPRRHFLPIHRACLQMARCLLILSWSRRF